MRKITVLNSLHTNNTHQAFHTLLGCFARVLHLVEEFDKLFERHLAITVVVEFFDVHFNCLLRKAELIGEDRDFI